MRSRWRSGKSSLPPLLHVLPQLAESLQPPLQLRFEPLSLRLIEARSLKRIGQAVEAADSLFRIVSVDVALAIPQTFHQTGRRVADRHRDGIGRPLLDRTAGLPIGGVGGVALRSEREIEGCLGESQLAFRGAETM